MDAGILFSSSERPDEIPPSLAFFAGGCSSTKDAHSADFVGDSPWLEPPSLAFFAGGDNSIRGYGYQSIGREVESAVLGEDDDPRRLVVGGTRLLTGSLELQRYVTPSWRVALFADGGDAFVDDAFDMNVGVGLGVHYLSPVGALRFEIAEPVTDDELGFRVHINIGAEF